MKIWIKWYIDILDNPKMGQLPDNLWRRFGELCLLAGKLDDNGRLDPVADMAWKLRVPQSTFEAELTQLAALDLVHLESPLGLWIVSGYVDKQRRRSAAERKREQRNRERVTPVQSSSHGDVTKRDTELDRDSSRSSDDIRIVVDKLRDYGVWEDVANELSALPHCTPAYVDAHCATGIDARLLAWRIREGVTPTKKVQRNVELDAPDGFEIVDGVLQRAHQEWMDQE